MKSSLVLFSLLIISQSLSAVNQADNEFPVNLHGYVKVMPGLQLDKNFSDPGFYGIMHNRLNMRWDISSDLSLHLEGRNRLLYNDMLNDLTPDFFDIMPGIEGIKDLYSQDDYLIDLSWVWLSDNGFIGHSEADRLFLSWSRDNWRIRAGRQRINWGINLVSNPNDLFNTYSFFDYDYPERPGADAVRVQHYLSGLSSIEIAVSPARRGREMVAAAKYIINLQGYDIQGIGGYYKNRLALGGGWAGHIKGAGFKGEATWFYDLKEKTGTDRGNVVAAAGLDYMFPDGTFVVAEFLYNGGHERSSQEAFSINEPLQPDNIMFSKYAITLSSNRSFSPIISSGLAVMALPDIEAVFIMPNLNYSLMTNLDLEVLAQIFAGGKNTIFEKAGYALFAALKYSF
jgi:hypothetical protein